ncbi:hypothetical protein F9K94_21125 [Brucella tritici]|uniref:Uncharacterized protein n=1 Tax=Brucella tritici TaxID=94626 RepID=A0A7V7VQJ8_9HYPH|nr:hypothetical protein [Brucella tritici]KAB2655062.1 hypothetical protein F9K94_21125 [Brucella tritici]
MNIQQDGLNIRKLSLLSGMTEAVCRASLSKEGFKLDGSQFDATDSLLWLSKRRSFIPNRGIAAEGEKKAITEALLSDHSMVFSDVITDLNRRFSADINAFTQ